LVEVFMSRFALAVCGGLIALLVLRVPAAGQAAVEAGIGAAASSIGSSGAQGVGKGIAGAFGGLNEALKSTGSTGGGKTISPAAAKPSQNRRSTGKASSAKRPVTPAAVVPAPSYEDALQIEKGIGQEELLRRFGPPAMQIASGSEEQTMSYISSGGVVQLEVQGGKVISVARPKPGA
jgi:hypothetical protein